MAYKTSWLIGSYKNLPAQDLVVDGDAEVLPAGSYYLYDATNSLSLLDRFRLTLLGGGVTASVFLTKSRQVRITSGGVFTLTWTDSLLRDLLGFTGNLAGSSGYVAPLVSPLLWSPARPESTSMAPLGTRGMKVFSTYQSTSPYDGTTESITHGSRVYNKFGWLNVPIARMWTSGELGGEWVKWFEAVSVPANPFKLYRNVMEEGTASLTEVSFPDAALGPYIHSAERRGVSWEYDRSRGKEYTDAQADIDIPCHVCPEIT